LVHTHPGTGAVVPSRTDMRNWCTHAQLRSDGRYVGVIVSAGAEETMNQRAWGVVDRGVYVGHSDGRVFHARYALEDWSKAKAA
jgi:hypothetical protein